MTETDSSPRPDRSTAIVIDASTMVDLLVRSERAESVRKALLGRSLVAPAHFDAEVTSAIGRLHRSNAISTPAADRCIRHLADAPIARSELAPLLVGAWQRRHDTSLTDAIYLELADTLGTVVLTTDLRLARAHPRLTDVP